MDVETLLDKKQVIESFVNLPDRVTADELIERILLIRLMNERLQEAKNGPGIPHEDFMRDFNDFKAQKRAEKKTDYEFNLERQRQRRNPKGLQ